MLSYIILCLMINIIMIFFIFILCQCADNLASWKKLAEEKKEEQEEWKFGTLMAKDKVWIQV